MINQVVMIMRSKKWPKYGHLSFFCMPTTFFFLGGALIVEINSLIFKNPVLKKNYEEEVPIDFILFCYFVAVYGTRTHCIFFGRWLWKEIY